MRKIYLLGTAFAAIALGNAGTAEARSSQWWYVADGADRVLFVDIGSIEREGNEARYTSSLIVRDPADELGELRAFMEVDCSKRTMAWPIVMRFGRGDERLDETAAGYIAHEPVEPGTLASVELAFVCSAGRSGPDMTQSAFPIAVDSAAFAEALIANKDPNIRPAEIYQRLRTNPATPIIRSTAPSPETFGTEQDVITGQPIVPPRDYARGVEVPPLEEYDADEVGRIYDIAYQGFDRDELAFEIRGYAVDDLAHSGSGQTLRFPKGTREVQVRDLAITIIEAMPGSLRYRVQRRLENEPAQALE